MDSAGIPWYSTGTVNVTQGSNNVAGVGTNWVNAGLKVGDIFTIDKSRLYQITAINSNTSLTLQDAYQGATGTAQVYFVIRNFAGTMQAQIAAQVAELVNKYESYIDTELKQITGPAGPVSFPYRGAWATGRSYNGLDIVLYQNQLYMALYGHTSTSANAPGATGTAWTQLTFDASFPATEAAIAVLANSGAKNIIPNNGPISETINGVSFVKDNSGVVTVNGTATSDVIFKSDAFELAQGEKYILSGCPTNGGLDKFRLFCRLEPYSSANPRFDDTGNGITFTSAGGMYIVGIFVTTGTTMNNSIFRPMLRNANIKDSTYVPFGRTNSQLTEITRDIGDTGWIADLDATLPCRYRKKNGVTYCMNANVLNQGLSANVYTNVILLPPDYRPKITIYFLAMESPSNTLCLGRVSPNGDIALRPPIDITTGKSIALNVSFPV